MRFFTPSTLSLAFALTSCAAAETFPKVNGLRFQIGNSTKYFTGTNAYWLPFTPNNDDIDITLDHIAAAGLKVVRTWGFNDVNELPSPGVYNAAEDK
jgi:mannan endo-1,4-beta-mannosidase